MARIKKRRVFLGIMMLLIIIVVIVMSVIVVKKIKQNNQTTSENTETNNIVALPDTTYSDMEVKDIEMEYLDKTNETMVSMVIENTSENNVEKEKVEALLVDKDGNVLGQTQTYIEILTKGQQYRISVVLKGDLTATATIKLQKVR